MIENIFGIASAVAEETAAVAGAEGEVAQVSPVAALATTFLPLICTIGGIYGTITGLKDDTVTLSVGKDNLSMVVARWAIRSVEEVTIENDAQELN